MKNFKKYAFGLAVAAGLTVTGISTAQAQDWQRRGDNRQGQVQRQRGQASGQVDSNGNIDRNRNGIDDRYETRDGRVDINQNGVADQDENNRGYGNQGRYDNRGYGNGNYRGYSNASYGYNNGELQQGYRDGLNRGQEDARSHRAASPYNSEHFRNGDAAYREGFSRGYNEGYRQSGRRW